MAISKFVPADLSKTAYFTLRRHATERHHAAPSSQSRWTTAERTMTPAEASLKGVDRPPAIKERATRYAKFVIELNQARASALKEATNALLPYLK